MVIKKEWFATAILLVVSIIIIIWNLWSLYLNPQQLPIFSVVFISVAVFVVIVALWPKYRQRLVKAVYAFHIRGQEKGGRYYRYGYIAFLIIILSALALTQYPLVPLQYSTVFVISFLMLIAFSVCILVFGFFRVIGKWVLLLIAVAVVVGVLRALVWILMHT